MVSKNKRFFHTTTPAKILRWRPKSIWDRITANGTGWTPWEGFVLYASDGIPVKNRSSSFSHPTAAWREWLCTLSQEKVRFEVIWYRNDLKQLGIDVPETETCLICDAALEATPVGIRCAYGSQFYQEPDSSNVTRIPPKIAALFFTKVCRHEGAFECILKDGIWLGTGGRNQIFYSGATPYSKSWFFAINNPGLMVFDCWWSKSTVDMNKMSVYKPDQDGTWLFLGFLKMSEANISAYWHHTGQSPYFEQVIVPRFIVATLKESTFELHVTNPTRFGEIFKDNS